MVALPRRQISSPPIITKYGAVTRTVKFCRRAEAGQVKARAQRQSGMDLSREKTPRQVTAAGKPPTGKGISRSTRTRNEQAGNRSPDAILRGFFVRQAANRGYRAQARPNGTGLCF